jgi:phage terminase large subunit-like protein
MTGLTSDLPQAVAELERRNREERLRFYVPTPMQVEFHLDKRRSRWEIAGNRTGKTVGLSTFVVLFALGKRALPYLGDWPWNLVRVYRHLADTVNVPKLRDWFAAHASEQAVEEIVAGYRELASSAPQPARIWVVSETFEVQRDVVQKEIVGDCKTFAGGWLPKREVADATYRDKDVLDLLKLKNGTEIGWKSYDQGRQKFQGTSQHLIAYDEEPPEDVHQECAMRVFDTRGIIIAAMTPLKGLTWVSSEIVDNEKKPAEKRDAEVMYLNASWDDNPYLSDDEKARLEATMDESERDARQYGRFLVPGRPVFNVAALRWYLEGCSPGEKGCLDGKAFVADPQGYLEVWQRPVAGHEYVIGADVAEGLEHGDFSAAFVLDRATLEHVALWHGHIDADLFGDELANLGYWYNTAAIAPEANNHGLTTITRLKHLSYPNIWRSPVLGRESEKEQQRLGWLTTEATKPLAVGHLGAMFRDKTLKTKSRRLIEEALSFVRDDKGKMGAVKGKWDDVVMSGAIAATVHATTELDIPAPYKPLAAPKSSVPFGKPGWVHPSKLEDERKRREREEWGDEPWPTR